MNSRTAWFLVMVAMARVVLAAQVTPAPKPGRDTVLKVAAEIMSEAVFCDFITIGVDGQPQSRVVQPQPPDAQFIVWVGTNPLTRKVTEIEKDPRVTLSYFDRARNDQPYGRLPETG